MNVSIIHLAESINNVVDEDSAFNQYRVDRREHRSTIFDIRPSASVVGIKMYESTTLSSEYVSSTNPFNKPDPRFIS